ncbi:MAG TPA: pseudouridine synthase [Verrucomicrobiae bacterium]|nr:pseudouridine synthase [Verrucomicrobiae bacterium]
MIPEKPRRLDQILSRYGYCSRSEGAGWLRAGRVIVRGAPAVAPAARALPAEVLIDGEPIESPGGLLALFHKPAGCICSHAGRDGPTIYDLLPARWPLRHPPVTSVGRLDRDTTGLLLLTDDGALVQRWTSPRHKVPKVYEVSVDADLHPELIALFASGTLPLEGEAKPCLPAKLEIVSAREARLELVEGRFHQVKRMFASQGFNVTRLHRSRFGQFELGDLQPGQWRLLALPVPP